LTVAPIALQICVYGSNSKNAMKFGLTSRTNASPDRQVPGNQP
jgi:hypothetical protein